MLRSVPGLRINDATRIAVAISTRGKNASAFSLVDCVMQLMIDGTLMPENSDIDALMTRSVYGVEVFSGPASIPLKLKSPRTDSWCGLIVIWTRSG